MRAIGVFIALAAVIVSEAAIPQLRFAWKEMEYTWESPAQRENAIKDGIFLPAHNLPLGLARWKNKLFVTVPRWKNGVASSLNYVDVDGAQDQPLKPYPSLKDNLVADSATALPSNSSIISVFRVYVDACDRLWVMDSGLADILGNPNQVAGPSLVIFDLKTDQLLHRYYFKVTDMKEDSFFANVIVDVDENTCDNAFAYIPDLGGYGVVVYSLKQDDSWRVAHHYFHFEPLAGAYNVGGVEFQWTDGVFGLALSEPRENGYRTMFFHAFSSTKEFCVSTELLRNYTHIDKHEAFHDFKLLGDRGERTQASASFYDPKNHVLFYTQVNRDGVGCWNSNKPYTPENNPLIFSDPILFEFPNDLKVGHTCIASTLTLQTETHLVELLHSKIGVVVVLTRQNGIDKIYKMDPQLGTTANTIRTYFIPACTQKYKCVLDQISSLLSQNPSLTDTNSFNIIIVPKVLCSYDSLLENRGLYGVVKLHSFAWELMSLDEQLLSLELPFLFKQLYVEHNHSLLSSISNSLWSLFQVTGAPKAILSVGKLASSVLGILEIQKETYTRDFISTESSRDLGALIIVDRDQDYASSLLTPATYSGLLSEIFNINCGHLDLNVKETKLKKGKLMLPLDNEKPTKNTVITLDSSLDSLYGEIKHRHFSEVLSVLSSKAKLLKNEDIKALGIQEIKHFVATKLQQISLFKQNLVNHVVACETIISEMNNKFENLTLTESDMLNNRNKKSNFTYVDENFGTDIHIYNSLRLMCLLSLTQGLSYEEYNSLVSKYLLAYGYNYLYVFNNLVNSGLLVQPSSPKLSLNISNLGTLSDRLPKWQTSFQTTANKLKQLPQGDPGISPSYVFNGGYVPLIAVLCNAVLTSESLTEVLTKLSALTELKVGGEVVDNLKDGMETLNEKLSSLKFSEEYGCRDAKALLKMLKSDSKVGGFPLKPQSVLVYVIGGVTYAEIAACDVVQSATGSKIYIASDCVANGSDLMAANA